ncbi:uncharacterized protein SPSK_10029 [Sporothrix schenckii 1099-18]|uniref:Uncharacterized protein n=1 Tax=Sporothrix schenckii 1099-18 TaxID=1397361 RepID=A0A0F2M7I8_SPOSC|nr:uncharacterized protein SPSK_10029 [Sporothrix schenckii 1099-18]KJR85602.1 hypothetical protein SPSK_10029 [Sporothrix schenckii 1099-18]
MAKDRMKDAGDVRRYLFGEYQSKKKKYDMAEVLEKRSTDIKTIRRGNGESVTMSGMYVARDISHRGQKNNTEDWQRRKERRIVNGTTTKEAGNTKLEPDCGAC